MKFNNLIEAVKAIKLAASKATIEKDETNRYVVRCGIGLKDTKDLVEAIMAFGVRRFLEEQSKKTDFELLQMHPEVHKDVCGCWDAKAKWCCNLIHGHYGPCRDHVSGVEFNKGGGSYDSIDPRD